MKNLEINRTSLAIFDEISTNSSTIIKNKWENVKNDIKEELDMYLNVSSIASNLVKKKKTFPTLSSSYF